MDSMITCCRGAATAGRIAGERELRHQKQLPPKLPRIRSGNQREAQGAQYAGPEISGRGEICGAVGGSGVGLLIPRCPAAENDDGHRR